MLTDLIAVPNHGASAKTQHWCLVCTTAAAYRLVALLEGVFQDVVIERKQFGHLYRDSLIGGTVLVNVWRVGPWSVDI